MNRLSPGRDFPGFDPDQALLDQVLGAGRPALAVYPFDHQAVVLGRGSDPAREVALCRVREDRLPIYRRLGGGCSVFLDPGNLIVSTAFPAQGFAGIQTLFDQCTCWLIRGLGAAGIMGVYTDGISDLVLEDRKIGGACFYRTRGLAYYSAVLPVAPDLDLMARYLTHPPREPAYRRGRAHGDFVAGLNRFLPGITPDRLAKRLAACLDADPCS